ncbi:MAG: hypothetical protein D8M57_11330 [Candidatus Scalindua sp. AMX11]|nr:MAG: hypothetical protein DWQ00_06855 [Candidatus Scalindua sp.]NOG83477.1 hypothetical protein [Planctomycetota bacterium]RZV72907.1 MAG: hypothetical protein EX341_13875 [Candidatus Scalindua sp. SCAELEC01]TDE64796.1 MAG: hypothetical protein D8M57_11330 [Candidatus Scalindua sp. AMX11]GJQ59822.1 MAG: hypothetical protein SCALA701_26230 [Candidatus Scalindua sp.]
MKKDNLKNLLNSNQYLNLFKIDEMRNIIMQEQSRSDRSSHNFSMIVFEIEHIIKTQVFIDDLCYFLKSRLRSIDRVGWFTENQIGIVLPYTSAKNAARFAEVIQKSIKNRSDVIIVKVFAYPSIWPYNQQKDQRKTGFLMKVSTQYSDTTS